MDLASKTCIPCQGGVPPLTLAEAEHLLAELNQGWKLVGNHHLAKSFLFQSFPQTMQAANQVAQIAESAGHHPDLFISFKQMDLMIYTHKIGGLAEADFVLAAKLEQQLQQWDQAGRA